MKTSLLALLAATALVGAANQPKPPATSTGTVVVDKKKPTGDKKPAKEAAAVLAEPVSLVADSVDAATQIAMEAAKAAQAEADKLAAIGTDKAASPAKAKLAETAVVAGAAAAKELKKAKKEADAEKTEKETAKKPDAKKTDPKKPDAEKPVLEVKVL
jgi:hypothetical protein